MDQCVNPESQNCLFCWWLYLSKFRNPGGIPSRDLAGEDRARPREGGGKESRGQVAQRLIAWAVGRRWQEMGV